MQLYGNSKVIDFLLVLGLDLPSGVHLSSLPRVRNSLGMVSIVLDFQGRSGARS